MVKWEGEFFHLTCHHWLMSKTKERQRRPSFLLMKGFSISSQAATTVCNSKSQTVSQEVLLHGVGKVLATGKRRKRCCWESDRKSAFVNDCPGKNPLKTL